MMMHEYISFSLQAARTQLCSIAYGDPLSDVLPAKQYSGHRLLFPHQVLPGLATK